MGGIVSRKIRQKFYRSIPLHEDMRFRQIADLFSLFAQ
jgi:hypothetical protein